MKNPFELAPLVVAAIVGALGVAAINAQTQGQMNETQALGYGAVLGATIQIIVRVIGVS